MKNTLTLKDVAARVEHIYDDVAHLACKDLRTLPAEEVALIYDPVTSGFRPEVERYIHMALDGLVNLGFVVAAKAREAGHEVK